MHKLRSLLDGKEEFGYINYLKFLDEENSLKKKIDRKIAKWFLKKKFEEIKLAFEYQLK